MAFLQTDLLEDDGEDVFFLKLRGCRTLQVTGRHQVQGGSLEALRRTVGNEEEVECCCQVGWLALLGSTRGLL